MPLGPAKTGKASSAGWDILVLGVRLGTFIKPSRRLEQRSNGVSDVVEALMIDC